MKILHLCLASYFPDNYSYQENMLPKFHKEAGHDVEVITCLQTFDENGKMYYMKKGCTYQNEYDIKVTRLDYKKDNAFYKRFKRYKGTYEQIVAANPDIIFVHGCQFADVDKVKKYARLHKNVKVYIDNHADFNNSAMNWVSKNILHKIIWKHFAKSVSKYVTKFYGVLPSRVNFLIDVYGLSPQQVELLVMGADDTEIERSVKNNSRDKKRAEYGFSDDDFVVMTGGKIDRKKLQTLYLMQAVNEIDNDRLKLVVFGSVIDDIKEEFNALLSDKIKYIGWVKSGESYDVYSAADLVVFPGKHSVYWEQVAGQGIPMLVKYMDGITDVDLGGNMRFLYNDSKEELKKNISEIANNPEIYNEMKRVAVEKGIDTFSYRNIAKRSIEQ